MNIFELLQLECNTQKLIFTGTNGNDLYAYKNILINLTTRKQYTKLKPLDEDHPISRQLAIILNPRIEFKIYTENNTLIYRESTRWLKVNGHTDFILYNINGEQLLHHVVLPSGRQYMNKTPDYSKVNYQVTLLKDIVVDLNKPDLLSYNAVITP